MRTTAKYKICKRLGSGVFEKCQTQKFMLSEARGKKVQKRRRGTMSDFGRQLLEKQKVRYTYGISERKLARYVKEAVARQGVDSGAALYELLETRLDNVVYRLGLAHTRGFARQAVSHGHIMVNGRRMTIPSYTVKVNDTISIRENSRQKGLFTELEQRLAETASSNWLSFDAKKFEGARTGSPTFVGSDALFDLSLVLEFYSR